MRNVQASSRSGKRRWQAGALAGLVLATAVWVGCQTTPYRRNLPAWVRTVYVPMVVNKTAETGLEELITNAFIEELLADGRVDVVSKDACDAVVRVTMKEYKELAVGFSTDDVESSSQAEITFGMELFDKSDPTTPVGAAEDFSFVFRWYSEFRAVDSLLEVEARERLAESAGRDLTHRLMTRVRMTRE